MTTKSKRLKECRSNIARGGRRHIKWKTSEKKVKRIFSGCIRDILTRGNGLNTETVEIRGKGTGANSGAERQK